MPLNSDTVLLTLFVAVTSALAQSGPVTFSCIGNGITGNCGAFVATFCENAANTVLPASTSIGSCFNGNEFSGRCDFIAFNPSTTGGIGVPSSANCQAVLNNITAACPHGGVGNIVNALNTFSVDPNQGQCKSLSPCGN
ncbi:hypothetical protein GALMADRAFT_133821 [Galerina marginata CBS 339.88]|uniref:Glycan binding protein Y3-like domain-containing protein n=1 Tax=Galerina marginata (strain CBS 339.88) TaxID=685588 RepID=A0A067TZQ6_GALM3|nr:hypothetical protein GALMADRAFT_133821 [Galerina marginata CBS 339.88]